MGVSVARPTPFKGATRPRAPVKARGATSADPSVAAYLRDIGRVPRITHAKELELGREIAETRDALKRIAAEIDRMQRLGTLDPPVAGLLADAKKVERRMERARDALIVANLRLVVHVAKKHSGHGPALMDLVQEGSLGLMRAVELYDYRRGYKFSTYAFWWIKQAIDLAILETNRVVRVPAHAKIRLRELAATTRRLELALGRTASLSECAESIGMRQAEVVRLLRVAADPIALDGMPQKVAQALYFSDPLRSRDPVMARQLVAILRRALKRLTPREAMVLRHRFGMVGGREQSLGEIGLKLGLSRERIRQIQQDALRKLSVDPEVREMGTGARPYGTPSLEASQLQA